jgi:signal peptidase I
VKKKRFNKKLNKNIREWVIALFFAIILSVFIKIFFIQSFLISSTNMESTLLKGDYVMVNKFVYGTRLPITLLSLPFTSKYLDFIQLPYLRLPSVKDIDKDDLLVFNYPMEFDPPIDKKRVMVSRCIALPKDTINIDNKKVFVNGVLREENENIQFSYRIVTNGNIVDEDFLKKYNITEGGIVSKIGIYDFFLTHSKMNNLKKDSKVRYVRELKDFSGENTSLIFPIGRYYSYNKDNFGKLVVPFKGQCVELNTKTIELYRDVITEYEENELYVKENKIFINNKETSKYTIKRDYYFVLDDNRDNAKDSRYWGFLPKSYIIGKVSFVWLSIDKTDGSIRWNRVFKSID